MYITYSVGSNKYLFDGMLLPGEPQATYVAPVVPGGEAETGFLDPIGEYGTTWSQSGWIIPCKAVFVASLTREAKI